MSSISIYSIQNINKWLLSNLTLFPPPLFLAADVVHKSLRPTPTPNLLIPFNSPNSNRDGDPRPDLGPGVLSLALLPQDEVGDG